MDAPPEDESKSPSDGSRRPTQAWRAIAKVVPEWTMDKARMTCTDVRSLKRLGITPAQAVREGREEELDVLLTDDPSALTGTDREGMTLAHKAALLNSAGCLRILAKHKADLNALGPKEAKPLHAAARSNSSEAASVLLTQGAKVNSRNFQKRTPLHLAAAKGSVQIMRVLLSSPDVLVDARDESDETPLTLATVRGHTAVVEILLGHGADVTTRNQRLCTPFLIAASEGSVELLDTLRRAVVKKLGEKGSQRKMSDTDANSQCCLQLAVINNMTDNVEYLLKHGASVDSKNSLGRGPLHHAAMHGNTKIVDLLIKHGCSISDKDNDGHSAFHVAAVYNQVPVMEMLMNSGDNINAKDAAMMTPLMLACQKGNLNAVQFLLENGAQSAEADSSFRTAFHHAVSQNHYDVLIALLKNVGTALLEMQDSADQTVAHLAASNGDTQMLQTLINHKCKLDVRDVFDRTPLHLAAMSNRREAISVLVEASRHELNDADIDFRTPLHIASYHGFSACLKVLLERGAAVDSKDQNYCSALMLAAMEGHEKCVGLLLDNGADVNALDTCMNSALHFACKYGNDEVAKVLLKKGASVVALTGDGFSPLQFAALYKQTEAAKVLLQDDSWQESMSVRDKNGLTPMDLLIENTPEAAIIVLDRGIHTTGCKFQENYTIHFDFHFLDPGPDDPASKKEPYFALRKMASCRQEDLLCHTLSQMVLKYKWEKYGVLFFYPNFFMQLLVSLLFCIYLGAMPKITTWLVDTVRECPIYLTEAQLQNETIVSYYRTNGQTVYQELPTLLSTIQIILLAGVILRMVLEFVTLVLLREMRLKSFIFYCSMVNLIFSLIGLLPLGYLACANNWRFGSLSLFLTFNEISLFIMFFETVGIYFAMFGEVLKSLLKVSMLLIFYCVGFSIMFAAFMPTLDGYKSNQPIPLSLFSYTMGAFNYIGDAISHSNAPFTVEANIAYSVFLFVMPLALVNLLIGVAIEDIGTIRNNGFVDLITRKVNFVHAVDLAVPKFVRRKYWYVQKLEVQPNAKPTTCWGKLKARLGKKESLNCVEKTEDKSDEAINKLHEEVDVVRTRVDQLCTAQKATMDILKQMCAQMSVKLDDDVNADVILRTPGTSRMEML